MGLLEELIVLVKETIDEARERNEPPRPEVGRRDPEELEALRQRMAQRAAEARQAEQEAEERDAQARVQEDRQRQVRDRERQYQKQAKAVQDAQIGRTLGADPRRLVRLLHQPQALRDLVVLREILDRPLALRRR